MTELLYGKYVLLEEYFLKRCRHEIFMYTYLSGPASIEFLSFSLLHSVTF
jgi:hypothetical protein